MLLILELIFLGIGLWILISGKVPLGAFKLLFGRGEYLMAPRSARLFGALLTSPLPVSAAVSSLLLLLAPGGSAYAIGFELVYTLAVIAAAVAIARRSRRLAPEATDQPVLTPAMSEQRTETYGKRLLIIAGLAVLSCITVVSLGTLVMMVASYAAYGGTWTGNFMEDVFPWIVLVAVSGLGVLGIVLLLRRLRSRISAMP